MSTRCARLVLLVILFTAASAHASDAKIVLPLAVHVAKMGERDVVDRSFVADRIARANAIYAPYGIAFETVSVGDLDGAHADVATREDRDALGSEVKPGAIHVFVVHSLIDVDAPPMVRRGVHWHCRTRTGVHFVILSSIAGLNVLAHELGHLLGNPKHSDVAGNLMSYHHLETLPVLDAEQIARLRQALQGYVRRGEFRPLAR